MLDSEASSGSLPPATGFAPARPSTARRSVRKLQAGQEDLPDEMLQLLVKPMSLDATVVGTTAPAPRRSLRHFYRRDREEPCVTFATALSTLFPLYTHRQNRECFCPGTF